MDATLLFNGRCFFLPRSLSLRRSLVASLLVPACRARKHGAESDLKLKPTHYIPLGKIFHLENASQRVSGVSTFARLPDRLARCGARLYCITLCYPFRWKEHFPEVGFARSPGRSKIRRSRRASRHKGRPMHRLKSAAYDPGCVTRPRPLADVNALADRAEIPQCSRKRRGSLPKGS